MPPAAHVNGESWQSFRVMALRVITVTKPLEMIDPRIAMVKCFGRFKHKQ
jgi:hypothetical protein